MFQWRAENKFLCRLLVINSVVRGGEEGLFIYLLFYFCNETATGESWNAGKVCFAIAVFLSSLAGDSGLLAQRLRDGSCSRTHKLHEHFSGVQHDPSCSWLPRWDVPGGRSSS